MSKGIDQSSVHCCHDNFCLPSLLSFQLIFMSDFSHSFFICGYSWFGSKQLKMIEKNEIWNWMRCVSPTCHLHTHLLIYCLSDIWPVSGNLGLKIITSCGPAMSKGNKWPSAVIISCYHPHLQTYLQWEAVTKRHFPYLRKSYHQRRPWWLEVMSLFMSAFSWFSFFPFFLFSWSLCHMFWLP